MPELPASYADDPKGWVVPPPYMTQAVAPGERIVEGRAACATLFGRGSIYDRVPPDERRRLLLLSAAAADATAAQSTHALGYRTRLTHKAAGLAKFLLDHDREHGTGRGRHSATDPRWTDEIESVRAYVRQEWSAHVAADMPKGPHPM